MAGASRSPHRWFSLGPAALALGLAGAARAADDPPSSTDEEAPNEAPAGGTSGVGEVGPVDGPEGQNATVPRIVERLGEGDLASDHLWSNSGLRRFVTGLAVLDDQTIIAVTRAGEVQRKAPGSGWRLVLAAPGVQSREAGEIDDEELLLDAEAAVEDFSDDDDGDDPDDGAGGDPEDEDVEPNDASTDDASSGAADESGLEGAPDALEMGLLDAAARLERGEGIEPGVWSFADSVLVSRPDGAWRSTDGGASWETVPTLPAALDVVEFPGFPGELVAATVDGVFQSGNAGESWFEVESTLSGERVNDLVTGEQWIYAGTEHGLFRSQDGMRWTAAHTAAGAKVPIRAVALDPSWEGGLWLAAPIGILRSDDAGASVRVASRNPLVGTRVLLALPTAGRVLSAGDDGVWESIDGGARWRPVVDGLPGPAQRDLVLADGEPILGGAYGVWRLGRSHVDPDRPAPSVTLAALPALGELIDVSLRRGGASQDPLALRRGVLASYFIPVLNLSAALQDQQARYARFDSQTTWEVTEHDWTLQASVCFGNCGGLSAVGADIEYSDAADYAPELIAIDDTLVDLEDLASYPIAAASVAERLTKYRTFLSESLTELYQTRIRLGAEADAMARQPLQEQVDYTLTIQEVEAHLDAYTDGYFYRVMQARSSVPPASPESP